MKIWCVLISLIVCFEASWSFAHEGHRPLPTRGMELDVATGRMILTAEARVTLDVQTEEAAPQDVTPTLQTYGTLVSPWDRHALVSSPLTGRIIDLLVTAGETVSAGQVMATLESPDLESLQLEIRSAKTSLELALQLQRSAEDASRAGAIPEIRSIEAKNQVQMTRAALDIAQARWRSLQLPEAELTTMLESPGESRPVKLLLRSPIDGTVIHSDLSAGKIVNAKEHLFEVTDLSKIWLRIGVLEKDLSRVAAGQALQLKLTAFPGKTLCSRVDVPGQFLDPQTHLGTVWASFSNSSSEQAPLLPGMSGQVELSVGDPGKKLSIPMSAVLRDGAERFVLIEEERTQLASVYQKQSVVLGTRQGQFIEVRGGNLFPGDRVVTRGSHEMGAFFARGVLRVSEATGRDIGLSLETVARRTLAETITVDGLVDVPSARRAVASSQLGGVISRILTDRGQSVQAGQVLAEVVSQEFKNLQLDLLKSHLDAELQKQIVSTLVEARDAVSQRRRLEAEAQFQLADGLRQSFRRKLRNAGLTVQQLESLEETREVIPVLPVTAPVAGILMDFDKVLGHIVQPDEPVFEIHDMSEIRIQGFVSERDLSRVRIGQTVRVRFIAHPDEVMTGTLYRTSHAIGKDDRTMSVWVELDRVPRGPIQHNMMARLTILTGEIPERVAVPREALVREGTRAYLFVKDAEGIFQRRTVLTGLADDLATEVVEGLSVGELIAVSGVAALQTGYAALR